LPHPKAGPADMIYLRSIYDSLYYVYFYSFIYIFISAFISEIMYIGVTRKAGNRGKCPSNMFSSLKHLLWLPILKVKNKKNKK
jgi:hypothetical protein